MEIWCKCRPPTPVAAALRVQVGPGSVEAFETFGKLKVLIWYGRGFALVPSAFLASCSIERDRHRGVSIAL